MPATVEYLHSAFSFVVKLIDVDVVPVGNVPFGWPFERIGALSPGETSAVILSEKPDEVTLTSAVPVGNWASFRVYASTLPGAREVGPV